MGIAWAVVKRAIGIFFFLFLVLVVNILASVFKNPSLSLGADFLNSVTWLLVLLTIIFLVADLFALLKFPLNLPFPVFRAIGSVLVVLFVFKLFLFVDILLGVALFAWLTWFFWLLFFIVPVIVLIVGFMSTFGKSTRRRHRRRRKV
jgi:hypothetical protein